MKISQQMMEMEVRMKKTVAVAMMLITSAGTAMAAEKLTPVQELGKRIFFDTNLSLKRNQSCAACHGPEAGWTGPDSSLNVKGAGYPGSVPERFGNR
ncbi:MAG: cytochrome-c peroxidase, partial [candidate division KSB1 bacterium]|nr:cytochrome-c peroxidase [candidate division KSB1 bacterium]